MTTPYSPATATAIAEGATDKGYTEVSPYTTWDGPVLARFNFKESIQQEGLLFTDIRDNIAALRSALLPAPSTQVKILNCGDSITMGYGSSDGKGYRAWLADLILRQRVKPVMSYLAGGGWRLADIKNGIAAALAANNPDIVTINIGTNDYDFTNAFTAATYGALIDQILASSPTVKVACALVALSQQANGVTGSEQSANAAIQSAVNARLSTGRVVLSDQSSTTQSLWDTDFQRTLQGRWTVDGVHPMDAAALQMARAWFNTIQPWVPGLAAI